MNGALYFPYLGVFYNENALSALFESSRLQDRVSKTPNLEEAGSSI